MKYNVKVQITYEYEVTIEADSIEDAKEQLTSDPVEALIDIEQNFATTLWEDGINNPGAPLTMQITDIEVSDEDY